jgi:hypothetical protein
MDWRDSYHVICFLCGLRHARIEGLFSVSGPCREDMKEYGNWNSLHLSSEVPREQQCGQK